MKQEFLLREGHPHLVLFFAGWGGEANLFRTYRPAGADLLLVSDYRDLDFDHAPLAGYASIQVVGWSMGVWMAAHALSGHTLPIRFSRAVNGTPYPVDEGKGIPPAIFHGTLDAFGPATLQKFRRRMCGHTEGVRTFLGHQPQRTPDDLHAELAAICQTVESLPPSDYPWTEAWIGDRDLIFPAANQTQAWQGTRTLHFDCPHYADDLLRQALETLTPMPD